MRVSVKFSQVSQLPIKCKMYNTYICSFEEKDNGSKINRERALQSEPLMMARREKQQHKAEETFLRRGSRGRGGVTCQLYPFAQPKGPRAPHPCASRRRQIATECCVRGAKILSWGAITRHIYMNLSCPCCCHHARPSLRYEKESKENRNKILHSRRHPNTQQIIAPP